MTAPAPSRDRDRAAIAFVIALQTGDKDGAKFLARSAPPGLGLAGGLSELVRVLVGRLLQAQGREATREAIADYLRDLIRETG